MYRTPDGYWHASLNLGVGLDGKRLRRHVQGRTQGEVRTKLDGLKRSRDAGEDLTEPRAPTVGEWTRTWIERRARGSLILLVLASPADGSGGYKLSDSTI